MSDDEFPDVPSEFVESAPVLLQNESKPLSPDDSVPEPPSSFDDDDDDEKDKELPVDAFPAPPSDLTTTSTKSVVKQAQSIATKTKEKSLDDDVRWRAAQQLVHAANEREKQKKLYAAVKYFAEAIAKLNEIVADSPASSSAARAVALRDQITERRNAVKRLIKASTATNNAVAADDDNDELDVSAFPATPADSCTVQTNHCHNYNESDVTTGVTFIFNCSSSSSGDKIASFATVARRCSTTATTTCCR
jgi:hypothetical protein